MLIYRLCLALLRILCVFCANFIGSKIGMFFVMFLTLHFSSLNSGPVKVSSQCFLEANSIQFSAVQWSSLAFIEIHLFQHWFGQHVFKSRNSLCLIQKSIKKVSLKHETKQSPFSLLLFIRTFSCCLKVNHYFLFYIAVLAFLKTFYGIINKFWLVNLGLRKQKLVNFMPCRPFCFSSPF